MTAALKNKENKLHDIRTGNEAPTGNGVGRATYAESWTYQCEKLKMKESFCMRSIPHMYIPLDVL